MLVRVTKYPSLPTHAAILGLQELPPALVLPKQGPAVNCKSGLISDYSLCETRVVTLVINEDKPLPLI